MARKLIPPRRDEAFSNKGKGTVRMLEYLEENAAQTNEATDNLESSQSSISISSALLSQVNKQVAALVNESLISQSGIIAKLNKRIEQLENTILANQNDSKKFAQLENDFTAPFYKTKYDKLTIKKALVDQLILPQVNSATNPTIQFGDGDTGFYEESDDVLAISVAGVKRFACRIDGFRSESGSGAALLFQDAGKNVPSIVPNINDPDTGIGSAGSNLLSLIAGGAERVRVSPTTFAYDHFYANINELNLNNSGASFKVAGVTVINANQLGALVTTSSLTSVGTLVSVNTSGAYSVDGFQVVSNRGASVADASGGAIIDAEARTAINGLLARVRLHGLIA